MHQIPQASIVAVETYCPPSLNQEDYFTFIESVHRRLGHPEELIQLKRKISLSLGFKRHQLAIPFDKLGLPAELGHLIPKSDECDKSGNDPDGSDSGKTVALGIDFGKSPNPSSADRMKTFSEVFPRMGAQAAKNVIRKWCESSGLSESFLKSKITHVITANSVNWMQPGLSDIIVKALELPLTTSKLDVNFMGCVSGGTILRHAFDIVNAESQGSPRTALVVSCEALSLGYGDLMGLDTADAIVSSLFRDGAGAAIITRNSSDSEIMETKYRAIESGVFTVPNSFDAITATSCDISPKGLALKRSSPNAVISNDLPNILLRFFTNPDSAGTKLLKRIAKEYGTETLDIAMHGGGTKIIKNMQVAFSNLGFPPTVLTDSYEAFINHGNMSSASVFFALKNVIERQKETKSFKKVLVLAFGPGVTVEWSILTP